MWTAEQEVAAVKQQLPDGAWRQGASLARCVEDLRMAHDAAKAQVADLQSQIETLTAALRLAESVYRLNVVQPGEPSSVLEAMQRALAQLAAGGRSEGRATWQALQVECTCRVIEKCERCEAIDALPSASGEDQ